MLKKAKFMLIIILTIILIQCITTLVRGKLSKRLNESSPAVLEYQTAGFSFCQFVSQLDTSIPRKRIKVSFFSSVQCEFGLKINRFYSRIKYFGVCFTAHKWFKELSPPQSQLPLCVHSCSYV